MTFESPKKENKDLTKSLKSMSFVVKIWIVHVNGEGLENTCSCMCICTHTYTVHTHTYIERRSTNI